MAKYRKRAELGSVYVPGVGRVTDDRLLDGDYARFVPALLVEVSDVPAPARAPVEPPTKKSEPTMVMAPEKQAELVAKTVEPEMPKQTDVAQQRGGASKKSKK